MQHRKHPHPLSRGANLKKQAGLSTMEIIIYVIIAGLVIIGAIAAFSNYSKGDDINRFVKQMTELPAKIKAGLRPMERDYVNATTANVVAANMAPNDMIIGNTLQHSFGGSVTVAPGNINGGTNNAFVITSANIDDEPCMRVVERLQDAYIEVAINGTTVKDASTAITSPAVAANCTNTTNTIALTYQ